VRIPFTKTIWEDVVLIGFSSIKGTAREAILLLAPDGLRQSSEHLRVPSGPEKSFVQVVAFA
jgi:hypothetical protein